LLETQQNCDLTYRMYDYGRPRQLHIEKSLEATRLVTKAGKVASLVEADRTILINTELFRVERVRVEGSRAGESLAEADKAQGSRSDPELSYLFAAAGNARVTGADFATVDLPARGIVAIPAVAPAFAVADLGGLELIRITPNWP
jgi:mannose-6-phosphate isomerase